MAVEKTITNLRGPAARITSASAMQVPADQAVDIRMTGTDQNRGFEFDIPRGLPGVNAVENDEAVATYIGAEGSEVRQALARVEPRDVNLREAGVRPGNSAATNDANLALAVSAAPVGSRLMLPFSPDEVMIGAPVTTTKILRFAGLGGRAKISQTVWGLPVFDLLNADGSSVEDFDLRMTAPRAMGSGAARDGAFRTYAAAVWASGSGYRVSRISADGFTSGIRLTNWNETAGARTGFASDCLFEDIDVQNVDWGIVGTGWRRVQMRRISGSYSLTPSSPDPSHLVYVSEAQPSQDITLSVGNAFDGTGGHAYQFKGVQGLTLSDLTARNSTGLMSLREVQEMEGSGLRTYADIGDATGSIFIQGAGTERDLRMRDVSMDIVTNTRAIRIDGTDGIMKDATIRVAHTTSSDNGDIMVYGTRNTLDNVRVINAGADTNAWRAVLLVAGDGHRVRGGGGTNVRSFVQVLDGATNAAVEFDPRDTTRNAIAGARTVTTTTPARATARVRPSRTVVAYTAGVGAGVPILADECTHAIITVTGATGFSISITEPHVGAEITVQVVNTSGGVMGAINWSGITLASAWSALASGETRTVRLLYNGTTWREVARA